MTLIPILPTYRYRTTTAAQMASLGPYAPCTITAEALFESLPADGSLEVRWTGFGFVGGIEKFATHQLRRGPRGVQVVNRRGQVANGYPLGEGRTVRTFRRVPANRES